MAATKTVTLYVYHFKYTKYSYNNEIKIAMECIEVPDCVDTSKQYKIPRIPEVSFRSVIRKSDINQLLSGDTFYSPTEFCVICDKKDPEYVKNLISAQIKKSIEKLEKSLEQQSDSLIYLNNKSWKESVYDPEAEN